MIWKVPPRSKLTYIDGKRPETTTVDDAGIGGQTAIFHAVTQFDDCGLPLARLLVERGADLSVRVKLPGHYEQPDEVVECTPLGYARLFQKESYSAGRTIAFLRERRAID